MGAVFLLYALATGLARVYCGIHFPFDIAASWIIHTFRHRFAGLNRFINRIHDAVLQQLLRNDHKEVR